jgi:hypothetical protein
MQAEAPQWVQKFVWSIDRRLREDQGITEYSHHPRCLFRIEETRADRSLRLSDGTELRLGERVLKLHFWNERIPEMGGAGATVGWARRASRAVQVSLEELARALEGNAPWRGIDVICADMSLAAGPANAQLLRISARYGFEAVGPPPARPHALRRLGEGILACMLVLASNPAALRVSTLRRECVRIYLSRTTLVQRYVRA